MEYSCPYDETHKHPRLPVGFPVNLTSLPVNHPLIACAGA